MSVLLWILVSAVYLVLLWTLGINTFRRGHYALFFVGIVFPIVWIVGSLIPPRVEAGPADAPSSLS